MFGYQNLLLHAKHADPEKKRKRRRKRGKKEVSTTAVECSTDKANKKPTTKTGKKNKTKMTGTKDSSTGQPTLKPGGMDTTQPGCSKSQVKKTSAVETTPHSGSKLKPSGTDTKNTKSQVVKPSGASTTPQIKGNSPELKPGSTDTTRRGNNQSTREMRRNRPTWHNYSIVSSLTPLSFVGSKANDITICPWISGEAFAAVYTWLYSSKTEAISKGVARVAAWGTRDQLPVGIEITACLCEALLMEVKHNASNSYQVMSFGYSIAITR